MAEPVYRRVVIKLSGEYFAGAQSFGIDQPTIDRIAGDLIAARQLGVEVAVVVGGGNIVRGVEVSSRGVSRPTGDTMGMLATVMNCLALEEALERHGQPARTLSALRDAGGLRAVHPRVRRIRYLAEGRIVLLGGGTGNPFFTTDTTAVLRAAEIGAAGGAEGHQCRRRLQRRSEEGPVRQAVRPADAFAGDRRRLQGHGCDRIRACPRDVAAYHRVLDRRAGFDRRDPARHRPRHHRRRLMRRDDAQAAG